jgi:hypothetical protein
MMAETPPRRSSPAGGVALAGDEINPFRTKFVSKAQLALAAGHDRQFEFNAV